MTAEQTPLLAGVELGGTKCVCLVGRGPGDIAAEQRIPTTSPDETLAAIERLLADWRERFAFAALGVASFGPLELDRASPRYGHITTTPKPGWRDTDVAGRLARLGVPTGFDTDVTGAALAEARWGAAQGLRAHAYITVGTGVGAGVIVGGRPVAGLGHAEAGHIRVGRMPGDEWPGACPYHGDCVEGLASGAAIEARVGTRAAALAPDHPVWDSVADAVAGLVQNLALIAVPQRVVIGGGVFQAQTHLFARVRNRLAGGLNGYVPALASPEALEAFVVPPGLGALAGPLGALALAADAQAGH